MDCCIPQDLGEYLGARACRKKYKLLSIVYKTTVPYFDSVNITPIEQNILMYASMMSRDLLETDFNWLERKFGIIMTNYIRQVMRYADKNRAMLDESFTQDESLPQTQQFWAPALRKCCRIMQDAYLIYDFYTSAKVILDADINSDPCMLPETRLEKVLAEYEKICNTLLTEHSRLVLYDMVFIPLHDMYSLRYKKLFPQE